MVVEEDRAAKKLELGSKEDSVAATKKHELVSIKDLFQYATWFDYLLMIWGAIGACVVGFGQPAMVILFADMINNGGGDLESNSQMREDFDDTALKFAILGAATFVAGWVYSSCFKLTGYRQGCLWRKAYIEAILRQEVGWFDTNDPNELPTFISESTANVEAGVSSKLGDGIRFLFQGLSGFIIAFVFKWDLALVMTALSPLAMFGVWLLGHITSKTATALASAYAKAGAIVSEAFGSIRTVAALQGEEKTIQGYTSLLDVAEKAGIERGWQSGFGTGMMFGSGNIMAGLGITYAAYTLAAKIEDSEDTKDGYTNCAITETCDVDGGDMLIGLFCLQMGAQGFGLIEPALTAFVKARTSAYTILQTIQRVPAIARGAGGEKLGKVEGQLQFSDVEFAYPSRPDRPVLRGFNLTVEAGTTVALVGTSGCGKSTSIQLLERFYDPHHGTVSLDGADLKTLDVGWLRSQIGLVSQEPVLFTGSIAENIAYGMPGATKAEVEAAAVMANAHEFITGFDEGYNTQVGTGGGQLSGGQKQRIAIARAMMKDPAVLLLDEATSALDNESERVVQAALDDLMEKKKRTTLVIAHRLTTIRNADKIVVVDEGVVVEEGTHDSLMAKGESGHYHALVSAAGALAESAEPRELGGGELDGQLGEGSGAEKGEDVPGVGLGAVQVGVGVTDPTSSLRESLPAGQLPLDSSTTDHEVVSEADKKEEAKRLKQEKKAIVKRVWRMHDEADRKYFLAGGIGALFGGAVNPVIGYIFTKIMLLFYVDTPGSMRYEGRLWAVVMVTISVLQIIGETMRGYGFAVTGEKLTRKLRELTFSSTLHQEIGWFDLPENAAGTLAAHLATDVTEVQALSGDALGRNVFFASTLIAGFGIGFGLGSYIMTFVALGMLPLMGAGMALEVQVMASGSGSQVEGIGGSASAIVAQAVSSVRTVAAFNLEDTLNHDFRLLMDAHLKKSRADSFQKGFFTGFAQFCTFGSSALLYWIGGILVTEDVISFEEMLISILAVFMMAAGFGMASTGARDAGKAMEAAKRLFCVLDRTSLIDPSSPGDGTAIDSLRGEVTFENVGFAYPTRQEQPVLRGFNLTVEAGTTVALVGTSGCGKSTSIQLLERFYDPRSGRVCLDGVDIKKLDVGWLRGQIGLVSQEPVLFTGSIAENIAYGMPGATKAEVEAAAVMANAHEFITGFDEGYNTQVGTGGGQLSGGQKQRIAIARAMMKDPAVLLLDEATSALDNESERVVQAALDDLMEKKKRTTLVIAHRLTTIRNADKIVVVDEGVVVEEGTHDSLMAKGEGGKYFALAKKMDSA